MNPAAVLIAGVFSFCTPDGCIMGPPLKIFSAPMQVQRPPAAGDCSQISTGCAILSHPMPRPYTPMSQDQEREWIIKQGE
jgi:hypothetical protein